MIIGGCGDEAGAAGSIVAATRVVHLGDRPVRIRFDAIVFTWAIERREPVQLLLRNDEVSVVHLQWLEDSLLDEFVKRLLSDHFDDATQHVGRQPVLPSAAWLLRERLLGNPGYALRQSELRLFQPVAES